MKTNKVFRALIIIYLITLNQNTIMSQDTYRKAKEAKGLPVGSVVPDFAAHDMEGNPFVLTEQLKKGPLVLIFYRGHWCPVCNKHLKKLQDSLQLIYDRGATVVAVSPEKTALLRKTAGKTGAEFILLHDQAYAISDAFDVTFRPDSMSRIMYNAVLGANLKNAHDDDSQRLPVPATFIIAQDGKILWRHFDPDYKKRSTVQDIIKHLK